MRRLALLGLTAWALAACAASARQDPPAASTHDEPPPPWASQLPSEPGMLFAAGSAQRGDRATAVAAARSELAAEIEVSVRSERVERVTDAVAADSSGARVERYEREARAEASQRVAQERLPGVLVRETRDTGDRTWALVALDRAAWAAQLRQRLAGLDELLAADDGEPADAHAAGAAARRWLRLAPQLAERAAVAERLRVAAPDVEPQPARFDATALRAELARQLGDVSFTIGGDSAELIAAAREACAAQGLRAEDGAGSPADAAAAQRLALRLSAPSVTVARVGGEFRGDATASATLADAAGRALAELPLADRASALDADTARRRLLDKLGADLARTLDQNLLSYLARW